MATASEGNSGAVSDHDPDLVAYWKFDEGKGYLVKDSTENGNDLYLTGEPKWQVCTKQEIASSLHATATVPSSHHTQSVWTWKLPQCEQACNMPQTQQNIREVVLFQA